AVEDVDRIFNDNCIKSLARIGKLPATADNKHFAGGLRTAARIYARDVRQPTVNELNGEIGELHRATERRQYDQLATVIKGLSPETRSLLNARGARPTLKLTLPSPEALRGAQRAEACAVIARLTQIGGRYVPGRKRPGGRRSRPTWDPLLHAPESS